MNSTNDIGIAARPVSGPRRLARAGLLATLASTVATTLAAALARAAGVGFEIADGGGDDSRPRAQPGPVRRWPGADGARR